MAAPFLAASADTAPRPPNEAGVLCIGEDTMRKTKPDSDRGLGWDHRRQREKLIKAHRDGTLCWWCNEPMYKTQDLDADHSKARSHGGTKADRLLHSSCNRSRGDGSRDHLRPALGTATEPTLRPHATRQWW